MRRHSRVYFQVRVLSILRLPYTLQYRLRQWYHLRAIYDFSSKNSSKFEEKKIIGQYLFVRAVNCPSCSATLAQF